MSIDPDDLLAQVQAEASSRDENQSHELEAGDSAADASSDIDETLIESDNREQGEVPPEQTAANWPFPDFTEKIDPETVSTNVLGLKPSWYEQEEQEPEEELEFQPMTIEELEQLRHSTREEGFAEGKAEGQQQGLEQGHAEGLEQGRAQGREEGHQQGLAEGQQEILALSERWAELIERLHQPNKLLDTAVEQQLVTLAMQLAQEIVQVELKTNPEVIVHTLKSAVQALPLQKQQVNISLNPDDMQIIQAVFPNETLEKKQWQLLADGSVQQGDCVVETELSSVTVEMSQVIKQSLSSFSRKNSEADGLKSETE